MKIHKMFCIDEEINAKLQKINASALVNELLKKHFTNIENPYEQMTNEQLEIEEKKLTIRLEAERKIRELENKI